MSEVEMRAQMFCLLVFVCLLLWPPLSGHSDERDLQSASSKIGATATPILVVSAVHNAGGLTVRDRQGRPFQVGLTELLQTTLKDKLEGRCLVLTPDRAARLTRASLRYTLQTELSQVQGGVSAAGGCYLAVARLFKEGPTRLLIAQWAGSAASLLNLTSNLERIPNIDALGLVGELANQVSIALMFKAGPDQKTLLRRLQSLHISPGDLTVVPVDSSGHAIVEPISHSQPYGIRVMTKHEGTLYVIAMDTGYKQLKMPVPGVNLVVNQPIVFPLQQTLVARGIQFFVIVNCGKHALARNSVEQNRQKSTSGSPVAGVSPGQYTEATASEQDASPSIRLISCMPVAEQSDHNDVIVRLLNQIATEPSGSWIGIRTK
jgi:hypothetical protein